jgi:hypothetical protein
VSGEQCVIFLSAVSVAVNIEQKPQLAFGRRDAILNLIGWHHFDHRVSSRHLSPVSKAIVPNWVEKCAKSSIKAQLVFKIRVVKINLEINLTQMTRDRGSGNKWPAIGGLRKK